VAAEAFGETEHELRKRVSQLERHGHVGADIAQQLVDDAVALLTARVVLVPVEVYADRVKEARWRIPRDANDVPTVALALTLGCGIWTSDYDFFGCGLPTWTTDTLLRYLDLGEDI
jgi:predicted nucleic acid-binding protein